MEEAGLVTGGISLIREHTEKVKPPRALWVPFPFGLPLGHPEDATEQRAVLDAVLALIDEPDVPVLHDYAGELAPDETGTSIQAAAVEAAPVEVDLADEVTTMRRYWEQWTDRSGRTAVGVSTVPPVRFRGVVRFLEAFVKGEDRTLPEQGETPLPLFIRYCADDLRVLYLEARLVMRPGESQSDTQRWFWGETTLGSFLRTLRDVMNDSDDDLMRGCAWGIAR
ncbi:MAG TPA: hypothetical protein VFF24_12930 [Acidimicrobiia bacterium]|nr:hypothetical protein [Acidimicrobiia bacterium]